MPKQTIPLSEYTEMACYFKEDMLNLRLDLI